MTLSLHRRGDEIGELMDERVLVADLQARHPPVLHVGMIAVGDVHAAPAAHAAFVAVIEVLDAMQIVQIPERRRVLAVDLERVERLVPARVARRFERRERSVLEAAQERARVVDADRLDLAGQVVLALLDEGLGHRRDLGDRTVQPQRRVDVVRQQVAGDAAARDVDVETPESFAALRQILRDRPVLQELRAVVKDAAELALVEQLLDQRDGRARGGSCTRRCSARRPSRPRRPSLRLLSRSVRAASRTSPSCRPWRPQSRSRDACRWGWRCR